MYVTISPQKLGDNFNPSVANFVSYLEKENEDKSLEDQELFFNQYGEDIVPEEVIRDIDQNTAKLKKVEPKFYSITINPSQRELRQLQNPSQDLKAYTRAIMQDYANAFNREIEGRPITVNDVKYYAKIEHQRTYKGTDREIRKNQPYATKILQLKQDIRKIEQGTIQGNIESKQQQTNNLEQQAPHRQNGKRIVQGMPKSGSQSHIHIIVSRKDNTNKHSLSPGSKYKASEVMMNGKLVKRGFNRDKFFKQSEATFDKLFHYKRNYVERYQSRKTLKVDPKLYFSMLSGLPTHEKAVAFKLLAKSGVNTELLNIPTNKVQLAYKAFMKLKQGIERAVQSSSIGI